MLRTQHSLGRGLGLIKLKIPQATKHGQKEKETKQNSIATENIQCSVNARHVYTLSRKLSLLEIFFLDFIYVNIYFVLFFPVASKHLLNMYNQTLEEVHR